MKENKIWLRIHFCSKPVCFNGFLCTKITWQILYNFAQYLRQRASEIAYQFLDIFSIFWAPSILQSDDGRGFVNSVITELSDGLIWN